MKLSEKKRFFFRNLSRGLIWLSLLVAAFVAVNNAGGINYREWLSPVFEHTALVYFVYSLSEILFGIIPPEIFMMWGVRSGEISTYILIIACLAAISYAAGVVGFYAGSSLKHTTFFAKLKRRLLGKYEKYLKRFGSFVIIVAAVTPIPFSGTSMLVGSVHFPFNKYLILALTRFLRFAAYSFIIWKAQMW